MKIQQEGNNSTFFQRTRNNQKYRMFMQLGKGESTLKEYRTQQICEVQKCSYHWEAAKTTGFCLPTSLNGRA